MLAIDVVIGEVRRARPSRKRRLKEGKLQKTGVSGERKQIHRTPPFGQCDTVTSLVRQEIALQMEIRQTVASNGSARSVWSEINTHAPLCVIVVDDHQHHGVATAPDCSGDTSCVARRTHSRAQNIRLKYLRNEVGGVSARLPDSFGILFPIRP